MLVISSYIFLKNLHFHAYHGVLPQENIIGNDYIVNTRIKYCMDRVIVSDNLADTISYADVFECIKQEMNLPSKLLEHVAGRIGNRLLKEYPQIETIDLKIMKRNPPMGSDCDGAGVELHFVNEKTK